MSQRGNMSKSNRGSGGKPSPGRNSSDKKGAFFEKASKRDSRGAGNVSRENTDIAGKKNPAKNASKKSRAAYAFDRTDGMKDAVSKKKTGKSEVKRPEERIERYLKRPMAFSSEAGLSAVDWDINVAVSVETEGQLKAVLSEKAVTRIYIDEACFGIKEAENSGRNGKGGSGDAEAEAFAKIIMEIRSRGKEAGLRLRRIERDTDKGLNSAELLSRLTELQAAPDAVLIRSFDEAMMISDLDTSETGNKGLNHIRKIFDYTCYGYNAEAVSMLSELGAEELTYPIELNYRECLNLRKALKDSPEEKFRLMPYELLVYGHLPMMVSANCIRKTAAGCDHRNRFMLLRDRMQKDMPVRSYCKYCYNQIFNAEPLVLYDLPEDIRSLEPECLRYDFSVETPEEVKKILSGVMPKEITRGHFRHGVE